MRWTRTGLVHLVRIFWRRNGSASPGRVDTRSMDTTATELFLSYSKKTLLEMLGHIGACLAQLSDDEIWSRGAPHENSIGNLILHLTGNVRQWIEAGVGGEPNIRDRDAEFASAGGLSGADLLSGLRGTVERGVQVIGGVSPERLLEEVTPQNERVSVLEAIYHVVGHFQQHTGQIIFATKIYVGKGLGLYKP